jgi:hypothetical protein
MQSDHMSHQSERAVWADRLSRGGERSVRELLQSSKSMAKYVRVISDEDGARRHPRLYVEQRVIAEATHLAHVLVSQRQGIFATEPVDGDAVKNAKVRLFKVLQRAYSVPERGVAGSLYFNFTNGRYMADHKDVFETRLSRDIDRFIGELTMYIDRKVRITESNGGSRMI